MTLDPRLSKQVAEHPYPLLFATISGAHLYGFPSADSDYDLRGAHLLHLEEVVGLKIGQQTIERSGVYDGLEIDFVTHEVKKFLGLMLKKNGYVLEQALSPLVVHTSPEHEELKAIAAKCLEPASKPEASRVLSVSRSDARSRRRGDAVASSRSRDAAGGRLPPKPRRGRGILWRDAASLVVADALASTPPRSLPAATISSVAAA